MGMLAVVDNLSLEVLHIQSLEEGHHNQYLVDMVDKIVEVDIVVEVGMAVGVDIAVEVDSHNPALEVEHIQRHQSPAQLTPE